MKKLVVSRFALLGSAAAFVFAACSSEKPVAELAGPALSPQSTIATPGSFTLGTPVPGYIQVCVDGTSQDLGYVINVTGASNDAGVGVVVTNPVNLTRGNCAIALARTINLSSSPVSTVTLTVANAGVVTYTCSYANVVNAATDGPFCGTGTFGSPSVTAGSGAAVASANANHGSVVTFHLQEPIVVVPPPPPPPTVGCTYTQGWYKNQGNSAVPGTSFFGTAASWKTVLATKPKGNNYYNLADQYIPAKLAIGSATPPAAVATALTAAETFFTGRLLGNTTALPATSTSTLVAIAAVLDSFNNGTFAGWPHC